MVLTQVGTPAVASSVPALAEGISSSEIADLERYLDATKSNLLFARKVMLVEGPAELFLIPALVKKVKGVDLGRLGISVIPIYGVHFDVYAKLFSSAVLPKRCALVTDGDLKPSDANPELEGEDDLPTPPDLSRLENDFVHVFACATTFERAITLPTTLLMFAHAATDIGAPNVGKRLQKGLAKLEAGDLDEEERKALLNALRDSVLNTAIRFGKARFAQIAARHVDKATGIPKYIADAVAWLTES